MNNFKNNLSLERFITFLGLVGAVAQILTTVLKTQQKEISLEYFLTLWLGVTVVSFLTYNLIESYLRKSNIKFKILSDLNLLKKKVRSLDPDTKYFELLVLDWRITTEKDRADSLHGEAFKLFALRPYEFIRFVFGKLITQFSKGDKYHALSNLPFWANENIGESTFLKDNILAAKNGLSIDRIITLDAALFETPESHIEEIILLETLVDEIQEQAIKHPLEFHNISTRFYLVKKEEKHLYPQWPFVTVIREIQHKKHNGIKKLQIIPIVEPMPKSSFVQLRFEDSMTASRIENEHEIFNNLVTHKLRELLSLDNIKIKLQEVAYVKKLVAKNFISGQNVWISKDKYCIAKLNSPLENAFLNIRESSGYTVIDSEESMRTKLKKDATTQPRIDEGWRILSFDYENELPLRIKGYIAGISTLFANKIPILSYSCFSNLYILVEHKNLSKALNILSEEKMNILYEDSPVG